MLRERIVEPLRMIDTGFTVRTEQLSRLTTAYRPTPETGELSVRDDVAHSWWSTPPSFPDASGCLTSGPVATSGTREASNRRQPWWRRHSTTDPARR